MKLKKTFWPKAWSKKIFFQLQKVTKHVYQHDRNKRKVNSVNKYSIYQKNNIQFRWSFTQTKSESLMKISFSGYRREGVVNSLRVRGKRVNSEPNKWKTQRNLSGLKLLLPETLVQASCDSGCKQGAGGDNSFPYHQHRKGWTRSSLSWSGTGMGMRCNPVRTIECSQREYKRLRARTCCLVQMHLGLL